jgi:benzoylformate decarboxylase
MNTPTISGKEAVLAILREEGVATVFGNPGSTELPLMDALAREPGMRYVLGLQEGVVVAMADGYAQAGGRLGVVNVHISPGLGNAMGMLYNAWRSRTPLLVTAGQHDQSFATTEPMLWAELPPIAQPFVKWTTEVRRIGDLPRLLRRATKTALSRPTGPVFVSLPVDVMSDARPLELGAPTRVAPGLVGDRAAIVETARLLATAERPLFIVGDAVASGDSLAEMVELAELIGCPVMTEVSASTCSFPFTHPQYGGPLPRVAPPLRELLSGHDLVFSVGGDVFTLSLGTGIDPMPHGVTVVHLDVDPWELGKNYPAAVAIQGEPKATLPELCEEVRRCTGPGGHAAAEQRRATARQAHEAMRDLLIFRAKADALRVPITPLSLVHAIADALPPDAVVIDESVSSEPGVRQLMPCADARSFFGLRGGGIGWGLPAALGVKLALPNRPVVCLVGDGSAMYTIQALWTAARDSLAVVCVVFNNASYRILKQRAYAMNGFASQADVYLGMDLDRPVIDYIGLAGALGVPGEGIEKTADVAGALGRAFASGGPYVIDVRIDPAFKPY